jgi:hypothetical protein
LECVSKHRDRFFHHSTVATSPEEKKMEIGPDSTNVQLKKVRRGSHSV